MIFSENLFPLESDCGIMELSTNISLSGICRGRKIVKERIEGGANEKAALNSLITALSFASISIFPG